MADIRQLVDSGVMVGEVEEFGGVLENFIPTAHFCVLYGHKQVRFGDKLSSDVVTEKPTSFHVVYKHPSLRDITNSNFVLVMSHADLFHNERLLWVTTNRTAIQRDGTAILALPGIELVPYEAPTVKRYHKIIFTLFKKNESLPIRLPHTRFPFRTTRFEQINELGRPLAAAFGYVVQHDNDSLSTIM